jgi:hypothetical protein
MNSFKLRRSVLSAARTIVKPLRRISYESCCNSPLRSSGERVAKLRQVPLLKRHNASLMFRVTAGLVTL